MMDMCFIHAVHAVATSLMQLLSRGKVAGVTESLNVSFGFD